MRHEVWKSLKLLSLALIRKFSPTQTTRRVLLLPVLLTGAASLVAQSAPAAGTWKVVPSPNGNQPAGNAFLATAALSPTNAWAVGAEPNPNQYLTAPLANTGTVPDGRLFQLRRSPHLPSNSIPLPL